MNKRKIGAEGETKAVNYLKRKGLNILIKNYNCKLGEIDIIAKDCDTIVFIEVKYRKDLKKGRPYESVDYFKQKKIIKSAMWYSVEHNIFDKPMRFDVLEIIGEEVSWIKNAFIIPTGTNFL